ncbi:MAG: patatin family protein [Ruminococcaceae bacterium]|nr:patatin family protein [Oscillospiraceae bacterium]
MSVGLVLEGGGMRGAFTAGVLQALHSEGFRFDYIAGVSAGALTAISYISGQPRRNYDTFVEYAGDPRYMGIAHLHSSGSFFNFDFVLGDLVYDLLPLDFDAFWESPCRLRIGVTDCETGRAIFYDKEALRGDRRLTLLRASSSLPLIAPIVEWQGKHLMDGGLASPIPIEASLDDGNDRHIIVMTRDAEYQARKMKNMKLIERKYARFPAFIQLLRQRHVIYEERRRLCYELEKQGKAVVIAPRQPITITRYEKGREKLAALHDRGLIDTAYKLDAIRTLVGQGT